MIRYSFCVVLLLTLINTGVARYESNSQYLETELKRVHHKHTVGEKWVHQFRLESWREKPTSRGGSFGFMRYDKRQHERHRIYCQVTTVAVVDDRLSEIVVRIIDGMTRIDEKASRLACLGWEVRARSADASATVTLADGGPLPESERGLVKSLARTILAGGHARDALAQRVIEDRDLLEGHVNYLILSADARADLRSKTVRELNEQIKSRIEVDRSSGILTLVSCDIEQKDGKDKLKWSLRNEIFPVGQATASIRGTVPLQSGEFVVVSHRRYYDRNAFASGSDPGSILASEAARCQYRGVHTDGRAIWSLFLIDHMRSGSGKTAPTRSQAVGSVLNVLRAKDGQISVFDQQGQPVTDGLIASHVEDTLRPIWMLQDLGTQLLGPEARVPHLPLVLYDAGLDTPDSNNHKLAMALLEAATPTDSQPPEVDSLTAIISTADANEATLSVTATYNYNNGEFDSGDGTITSDITIDLSNGWVRRIHSQDKANRTRMRESVRKLSGLSQAGMKYHEKVESITDVHSLDLSVLRFTADEAAQLTAGALPTGSKVVLETTFKQRSSGNAAMAGKDETCRFTAKVLASDESGFPASLEMKVHELNYRSVPTNDAVLACTGNWTITRADNAVTVSRDGKPDERLGNLLGYLARPLLYPEMMQRMLNGVMVGEGETIDLARMPIGNSVQDIRAQAVPELIGRPLAKDAALKSCTMTIDRIDRSPEEPLVTIRVNLHFDEPQVDSKTGAGYGVMAAVAYDATYQLRLSDLALVKKEVRQKARSYHKNTLAHYKSITHTVDGVEKRIYVKP